MENVRDDWQSSYCQSERDICPSCPDDYSSSSSADLDQPKHNENEHLSLPPPSPTSETSSLFFSRPPSRTFSTCEPAQDAENTSDADDVIDENLSKRRRLAYRTADREMSMKGSISGTNTEVHDQNNRARRRSTTMGNPIFYGRKKRAYNKRIPDGGH